MGGRVTDRRRPVPVDFKGDYKGTAGRATNVMADQSYMVPWNDPDRLETFFREHGETLACVVTEPVCVNGGSIEAAPGYLELLRALCTEYGVVLIFDEMITGVRMGVGGAQKKLGVTPDLTTFGKAIGGGGIPVSALAGKREIMSLLENKKVIHAGTYNGYPLGTAAVTATFTILSRDDEAVLHRMHRRTQRLQSTLVAEADAVGLPLIVQGPPGVSSFHCRDTPLEHPGQYDFELMSKDIIVATALQRHGVLISSVSRIYPNAQLSDEDVEFFEVRARKALAEAKQSIDEIF